MSVHIQALVYSRKMGGPSHKLVALKLADHANDEGGSIYPSQARVAAECELSDRQVRRILNDLIEAGIIRKVAGEKGGRNVTVTYAFDLRVVASLPVAYRPNPDIMSAFPETRTFETQNPDICDIKPGHPCPTNHHRTTTEPSHFDKFWNAYPKKADKGAARRAFKAALKKTDIDTLIAAAKRYAAVADPAYTKNPASWLNAEAWDNDIPTPKPAFQTSRDAALDANTEYWRRKLQGA